MPAMATVGGHGGGGGYGSGPAPAPTPSYHLPPMGNLRTKADVMHIDQFMEQMQSTIFENDDQVAAAGVGQPGAHYVYGGGMSYRTTNSPPTATTHHPSYHATVTATTAPAAATTAAAPSPHSATPALTPPSSAQSYTSGRSPISLPSAHTQSQTQPSTGMYPTLPATTAQEQAAPGYPTATSAAPPSTLSSVFDNDDRRRYTGGTLQRSRHYSASEAMDASAEGERRGSSSSGATRKAADNLIDPALRRTSDVHADQPDTPAPTTLDEGKPTSSKSPTPDEGKPTRGKSPVSGAEGEGPFSGKVWVESVRIFSLVRDFVRGLHADMEMRESQGAGENGNHGGGEQDVPIAQYQQEERHEHTQEHQHHDMDADSLYPVLKMHLEAEAERDRMQVDEP